MTLLVATRPNLNLRVKEADGAPDVPGVSVVVVPSGTLTNNGGGQVTLDYLAVAITLDTMANILASAPDAGDMFYATDQERFLIYDGTAFQMASPLFAVKSASPNIGADYPVIESDDPNGYYREFITNKTLYNSAVGISDQTTEGGVRLSSGEIQFYLDGAWQSIITGIRIREDDGGGIFLEFRPTGSDMWINATNGNSDQLDPAGNPVVWGQKVDIGAYSSPPIIGGRSLT